MLFYSRYILVLICIRFWTELKIMELNSIVRMDFLKLNVSKIKYALYTKQLRMPFIIAGELPQTT